MPETGENPAARSARFGRNFAKREEQIRQILTTLTGLGAI